MKTYKQFKKFLRDKCWNERDYGEWIYDKLIYDFLVEEVKENKELETSILEKLRSELERRLKKEEIENEWIHTQRHQAYCELLNFLISLETPQFTPWQEIECSHTWKEWDWFKEKFTKMVWVNKDLYGVEWEESWYRFARPIEDKIDHDQVKENIRVMDEQDGVKIEPELPEVPNFNTTSELIIDDFSVLKQIEALTTFCQSLARQKPTK